MFAERNHTRIASICSMLSQKTKSLVSPSWLTASIKAGEPQPCGDYAVVKELKDETARNCPDGPNCKGCMKCSSRSRSSSSSQKRALSPPPTPPPPPTHSSATGVTLIPDSVPWNFEQAKAKFDNISRYSCARLHPLVCPNQGLVNELRVMKEGRDLEGEARSALSYSRAIGVCISCSKERKCFAKVSSSSLNYV